MSAGIPGRAIFIIKNYLKDNKLLNFYSCRDQKFFYWVNMEQYRRGYNGADLKSDSRPWHVGSNPTCSSKMLQKEDSQHNICNNEK